MKKFNPMGLVFFVLIFMGNVGYSACEGDLDCDGDTDGADLSLLAADYGTTGCGTCDDVIDRIGELEDKIAQLEAKLQYVTIENDEIDGLLGPHIIFTGANIHIHSGQYEGINGLGNLVVGYNKSHEISLQEGDRIASHVVVIGDEHRYTSNTGFVSGYQNTISGGGATVTGGRQNRAEGGNSSVSGGAENVAEGRNALVSGGWDNRAEGPNSSVNGGNLNRATGNHSSVAGGLWNVATGEYSVVSGGYLCEAQGASSTASGGRGAAATGDYDWSAGENNPLTSYYFDYAP